MSSYAEVIINKFRRDQEKLFDILFSSRRGLIHESLLNPEVMMDALQNIQLSLRDLRFPMEIVNMNLYRILNSSEFIAFQSRNLIVFAINVPLTTFNSYTAYKITNVPRHINDTEYSFTQYQYEMIAINDGKDRYFPIDSQKTTEDCKPLHHDEILCKSPPHIYKMSTSKNCELSSFNGNPTNCNEIRIRKIFEANFGFRFRARLNIFLLYRTSFPFI